MTLLCAICIAGLISADYTPLEGREVTMQAAASSPTMAIGFRCAGQAERGLHRRGAPRRRGGFRVAARGRFPVHDGGWLVPGSCAVPHGVAKAAKLPSLQAHDVNIRMIGDVAIIHAAPRSSLGDGQAKDRPLHRHLGKAGWSLAGGGRARHEKTVIRDQGSGDQGSGSRAQDPRLKTSRPQDFSLRQRKFSTSINSSTDESIREKKTVRPSGVAVSPLLTVPRLDTMVVDCPVEKS